MNRRANSSYFHEADDDGIIMARSDRSDLRMTGRMTGARAHCVATLTEQSAGSSAQRSALKKGFLSWPATR